MNAYREQLQEIVDQKPSYWHERNARKMLEMLNRNKRLPKDYRTSVACGSSATI